MADRGGAQAPGDYSAVELLREVVLTGIAVVVPVVVSVYVLVVAVDFLAGVLSPISSHVPGATVWDRRLLAVLALAIAVLLVGFVAHFRTGERALSYFEGAVERIPGLGTIYRSFRRMSDVMLDGDADHFREVKLVPFPHEKSYVIGFVTATTPESIASAAGEGPMQTLFVPMGPNPFMGGYVLSVPETDLVDVDMTVEEGIRATVTSGVAVEDDPGGGGLDGPRWELSDFERVPAEVSRLRDASIQRLQDIDRERFESDRLRELESEIRSLDVEELESRLRGGQQTDRDDGEPGTGRRDGS